MALEPVALPSSAIEPGKLHAVITSWVACDACNKWRRIPKAVAESLQDDAGWCVLKFAIFEYSRPGRPEFRLSAASDVVFPLRFCAFTADYAFEVG